MSREPTTLTKSFYDRNKSFCDYAVRAGVGRALKAHYDHQLEEDHQSGEQVLAQRLMNLKAMNLKAEKGHRGPSDRPENLSCQRSLWGQRLLRRKRRDIGYHGIGPASARPFTASSLTWCWCPRAGGSIWRSTAIHCWIDPRPFDRIVVGPPRALLGIASRKRRRTM